MKLNDTSQIASIQSWLGSGSINVFGIPLSGKDTQCQNLAELLDAASFGGGDILRNSKVSNTLAADINEGKLAPTDEYLAAIVPYFSQDNFTHKPLVLSSVGRWIGEEKSVIQAAEKNGHPIKAVIWLQLSNEEALRRLKAADRGRVDDHEEKLITRMTEFDQKTQPVLHVYDTLGLLIKIDGGQEPAKVTQDILAALETKAK